MPDRLTPSEALRRIEDERQCDGFCSFCACDHEKDEPHLEDCPIGVLAAALAAQPQASPPGEDDNDEDGECELGKLYDAMAQVQYPEPASPPPTQGWEEALAGLEKFHDRLHTRTDGWHCTPQTCEVSRRLATLRSHLSGRETPQGWTRDVPTGRGEFWWFHERAHLGCREPRYIKLAGAGEFLSVIGGPYAGEKPRELGGWWHPVYMPPVPATTDQRKERGVGQ